MGKIGVISWSEMMRLDPARLRELGRVPLEIFPNGEKMFSRLARTIADLIASNNKAGLPTVLIQPVGPKKHFAELVEITNRERISWASVTSFNMDEWMDWQCRILPESHPWSFKGYMQRNLFSRIDADLQPEARNLFFPTPQNMVQYSDWLAERGGADLCYGGFGYSGHIANNEPPASRWWHISLDDLRNSTTRILPLNDETLVAFAHRSAGGNTKAIPPMAVTVGMKDILSSKRLLLVSDGGAWKQHTLRVLLLHPPTVEYPCTLVQEHPNAEVWVDERTSKVPPDYITDIQ